MKAKTKFKSGAGLAKPTKWQIIVLIVTTLVSLAVVLWMYHAPKYSGYDEKIRIGKDLTLYYNNSVSDSFSTRVASLLKKSNSLLGEDKDFLLDMKPSRYELKITLSDKRLLTDTSFVSRYFGLEWKLNESPIFSKPVQVKFVDSRKCRELSVPVIPKKKITDYPKVNSLIEKHIGFVQTLYYTPGISDNDISRVEATIKRFKDYFPDERELNILFLKDGNSYRLKLFEDHRVIFSPDFLEQMKSTIEYLKQSGIDRPVRLTLVEQSLFYERDIL